MQQVAAAAGLRYASGAELNALVDECRGRVLGIVGFGKPVRGSTDVASAWVDMSTIGTDRAFEVWTSADPVQAQAGGRIRSACNAPGRPGCSVEVERVFFQFRERRVVEHDFVGRRQHELRRRCGREGFHPAHRAQTPAVSRR